MGAKEKQDSLMALEFAEWRTPYDLEKAVEIIQAVGRASGTGGLRGKVTGEVVLREPDTVVLGWELSAALIPCLWFSTLLEREDGYTSVTLEVMRAKFSRQFPFPWTMVGRDKLRKFKALAMKKLHV